MTNKTKDAYNVDDAENWNLLTRASTSVLSQLGGKTSFYFGNNIYCTL